MCNEVAGKHNEMGETSTCSRREASGRRALNFRETVPRRLLFGLLLSPTSLGTRFRSALDLASDRALESALESALARSARLSLALALKTLVHMSHAWQLALAQPCVYSVLSALSLMSGCMFRQLALARPCVYSVSLGALAHVWLHVLGALAYVWLHVQSSLEPTVYCGVQ